MKLFRLLPFAVVAYLLFWSSSTTLTSCTTDANDTIVIRDTTIIKDTVTIRDTVTVRDSACHDEEGLIAYYNFNGGTLKDSSGNGNHIVFNNATPTTDRFGRANNAYLFNGSSSYMRVTQNAGLNPANITIMAIIKVNGFYPGLCHGNDIVTKGFDRSDGFYCLRFSDNADCYAPADTNIHIFYGAYGDKIFTPTGSSAVGDSSFVRTGQWYTVIYTYDGVDSKLYINGALKKTFRRTAVFTPNNADVYIGRSENSQYPFWFNGVIDEVRIYNRAVSASEVSRLSTLQN
ncbi:LamG domain-containing protein [Chitinophaga japonensis]|uniref:Concanavalin A-like lectin/glucanase superfamily protein n=1 Tax=Chitinophaga japonensis TaxID=104662 RepID=A0A562SN13_CHIJA|nr:LamG domain-containing protein [Chitinophaga japonensis]TWI82665.1 concanavalin A-like lectin/glucanase superfamily protein [Chitinophaga japonensis]